MDYEKKKAIQSLKTSKGQIEGILKMLQDDRYCADISNQIVAAQFLLKKANILILKQQLKYCVREACLNNSEEELDEITQLIEKLINRRS